MLLASISLTALGQVEYPGEDRTGSPYFYIPSDDPETEHLPLKSTSAVVNIAGVIADVVVTQEYKNEGKKPIEAIYVFPASTRAAVYALQMTIGERVIVAKVEEKAKARQDYEEAKRNGQSASLLEQERPNVFTMNVANIMPGDVIKVELKYTEILIPEDGIYRFVYPTVVGPRYNNSATEIASSDNSWNANPYTTEGTAPLYTFDMHLSLNAGMAIKDLRCPSHQAEINYTGKSQATVSLAPSEASGGNRDFILEYRLSGMRIETGVLLFQGEKENYFLAMIQPPDRVSPEIMPPREYVFIMDVSGSMYGYPINISKKLFTDLVGSLKPTDKFNIVQFAGSSSVFSPTSVTATKDNINAAIRFIDKENGSGGTELLPALKQSLNLKGAECYSRTFIIATDGYVTVEKEAFDLVRNSLGKANFFAFGIGTSVNRYLIEGLAHAGQGEPFIVTDEKAAPAAADKFRKYITSPVLTDVNVTFPGFDAYDLAQDSYPDIFAERPVIIFGKYHGSPKGCITITGNNGDGVFMAKMDLVLQSPDASNSALRYLWAREKIRQLDDLANTGYSTQEVEDQVTKLGLEYNLLTNYTSFVAIDSEVRNQGGNAVTVKQPLPLPEGVSNYAVGGVAVSGGCSRESKTMKFTAPVIRPDEQDIDQDVATAEEQSIEPFLVVEQMPEFPGGDTALYNYLLKNIHYPDSAKIKGIQGTVYVRFIVEADGTVTNVTLLRGIGGGCDEEAIRVVQAMPKWKAGKQNGQAVAVYFTLPIKFVLGKGK